MFNFQKQLEQLVKSMFVLQVSLINDNLMKFRKDALP